MSWPVALALFFVTFVAQTLLQRSYAQKSKLPESFPPALSYLIGVTPLGVIVGLLLHPHVHWSWWLGFLLVSEGFFIGLYNILSFMAIKHLPIARFQTVYQSYEVVVIALGWALLDETLNAFQIVGGILLLIAAVISIRARQNTDRDAKIKANKRAIILTLLSALSMGIGLVAEKAALGHMNIGAYFIFGYATQTLTLIILASKDINKKALCAIQAYDFRRQTAMGTLSACIGFFYIVAIVRSNNISLITALSAFSLPLVVLASMIVLREKDNIKLLGGATALGCLGLIISALH